MKKAAKQSTPKTLPRGGRPKIEITPFDIETAMKKTSGRCMIADAIKRSFPTLTNVHVDMQTIRWSDKKKGLRYVYYTPAPVMAILVAWDQGIKPRPFSFKVREPHILSMRRPEKPKGKLKRVHKFGKRTPRVGKKGQPKTSVGGGITQPILQQDRVFGSRKFNHLIAATEMKKIRALVQ